jgi:hypothetical protein
VYVGAIEAKDPEPVPAGTLRCSMTLVVAVVCRAASTGGVANAISVAAPHPEAPNVIVTAKLNNNMKTEFLFTRSCILSFIRKGVITLQRISIGTPVQIACSYKRYDFLFLSYFYEIA